MASKHRITVNLSEEEHSKLSAIAEKHRISMAWIGRTAINELLKKIGNDPTQLSLVFGTNNTSSKE